MSSLLNPIVIGDRLTLRNRVGMSSMTRNRCVDDYKPGPSQVQYYTDRARNGAGIIVTEGVLVDWSGILFPYAPFMVTKDHAEAWRLVTESVHEVGGKIFMQAWHPGRVQNERMPAINNKGLPILAPSAIQAEGGKYRDLAGAPGHAKNITVIQDPRDILQIYRHSATMAKEAGFDGIELLAQGGYLPHQFLNSRANQRTDSYGGSVANRCRFTLELVDIISETFGGTEFVSVKISPADVVNDSATSFEEMLDTFTYLIKELVNRKVGIVTISRRGHTISGKTGALPRPADYPFPPNYDPVMDFGPLVKFPGSSSKLMVNQDYTMEEAEKLVREGKADLASFGRFFIYNPDLVSRTEKGISFADNDRDGTVSYGPYENSDENYNDWPVAVV